MKKKWVLLTFLLMAMIILVGYFAYQLTGKKRPPIILKNASRIVTNEFQFHESILLDVVGLLPGTGYYVKIESEDGETVSELDLTTDQHGHIPETVIWYDIGELPYPEQKIAPAVHVNVSEHDICDFEYAGKMYTLYVIHKKDIVHEKTFRIIEDNVRPTLYAADSRGYPKPGFLIGEEDVWVVGRDFSTGSIIRLWAVAAKSEWKDGDKLKDVTKQYHGTLPPVFELKFGKNGFKKLLWPKSLCSVGSYDIVAEVITYPSGSGSNAKIERIISHKSFSGFVIQRRPGEEEPMEMDLAGSCQSPLVYRETFLTDEDVYVGVDPKVQPKFVGSTADVYIVEHKTEPQWKDSNINKDLDKKDVTGTKTKIAIQKVCGNCWTTLAWPHPLKMGEYDVVFDFNNNQKYDPGDDLIDALDEVGFTVSEARVNSISFNYKGSNAITISKDKDYKVYIGPPEYSATTTSKIEPAAWIQGGSYSVIVDFVADKSLKSTQIWAEDGLGGLSSSAAITFNNGIGKGTFSVKNVPTSVGKHLFYWEWKYKAATGTLSMGRTGKHTVYTVLAKPVGATKPFLKTLDYACTWVSGATTKKDVCNNIINNGFKKYYAWNYQCNRLAEDFVLLVNTQGINGGLHRWSYLSSAAIIDDMVEQRTNPFDPVGWRTYKSYDWNWHQWSEAIGMQWDPSAAASQKGLWGIYEDYAFKEYMKISENEKKILYYEWVANQPGQSIGCEAPAHRFYTNNPYKYGWYGPNSP